MHSKCVEMHSNTNFVRPVFPKEGHICSIDLTFPKRLLSVEVHSAKSHIRTVIVGVPGEKP